MESGEPIFNKPGKQMGVPGSEVQGGVTVKPVDAKPDAVTPAEQAPDPEPDPTVEVPEPPGDPDGDEGDDAEHMDDGRPRKRRKH